MILILAGSDVVSGDTSCAGERIKNAHHAHQTLPFGLAVCFFTRDCRLGCVVTC
jgi:hypothetical protein